MQKPVYVRKAADVDAGKQGTGGQTDGMQRKDAIVNKCSSLCASVMTAAPHTSSAVHHHGEQDTIVYVAGGHGAILSDDGTTRQELGPGDFALIPAWTEHQEVNDGDVELTWIITRSGGEPAVVNLDGWAGQMKRREEKEKEKERQQEEADEKATKREQAEGVRID
ncbi:hypothetical protein LZ554_004083 [Drepanopeziza brunnea f. sp. 'monogermtubi']|nr:hypothetical protein LZ554_004083 [Drepanopeziza brunnea f. sp. 'monogermtubi']